MENELCLDLDGTIFKFSLSSKQESDIGCSWTNANITIQNRFFNYQTGMEFLTYEEITTIHYYLIRLLGDEIKEITTLEFIEPDLKITLNPKRDLRNDPRYAYIREGFEIEDIIAEFVFYLSLGNGYTDERYTLPLYRRELNRFTEYLAQKIAMFEDC